MDLKEQMTESRSGPNVNSYRNTETHGSNQHDQLNEAQPEDCVFMNVLQLNKERGAAGTKAHYVCMK